MLTITKLTQGNIGSKGNTSCVFIDSRLATLLPNLPLECKYIIIQRTGNDGGTKCMKYTRARIERALTLLCYTQHPAWSDIQIDQEKLSQWEVNGDLASDVHCLTVLPSIADDNEPTPIDQSTPTHPD